MHLNKQQTIAILEQNPFIKEGHNKVIFWGRWGEVTIPHLVIRSLLRSGTIIRDVNQPELTRYKLNPTL